VADGFLGRWSQRKRAVQEGRPLAEPPPPVAKPLPVAGSTQAQDRARAAPAQPQGAKADGSQDAPEEQAPPLSLDDVKSLTSESDFSPFVARDVSPEVRNAAMKKLFADPHYNVMDRLDIYIDDYSKPDPLPPSMLRQMASAKFLKLFEEDEPEPQEPPPGVSVTIPPRDDADTVAADSVAQSNATSPQAEPFLENKPQDSGLDHDHTDLRLQPNHAAGPQEPGRSTE
jgi:hypothetical protein